MKYGRLHNESEWRIQKNMDGNKIGDKDMKPVYYLNANHVSIFVPLSCLTEQMNSRVETARCAKL